MFKSGYVTIVGKPNVGKSTLINLLLGQKIAAVSPRPQTTRRRQLGILTTKESQLIFVDTPGLHISHHKLGEYMNAEAEEILPDADVIVFMVDASQPPDEEDRLVAQRISELHSSAVILLAVNKVDLLKLEEIPARRQMYLDLLPSAVPYEICAANGANCESLLKEITRSLPEGAPLFDEEQVTDVYERDIAADLIREAALIHLRDEVPHAMAVRIDDYTERGDSGAYISATIYIERESQKPIVIGQGGAMLKKIGMTARRSIESMSGRKVFLEMHVKVQKNWRNSPEALKAFGFSHDKKDDA
jgi:GTP-binding protein Era